MTHTRFTIGLIAAAGALTVLAVAAQSEEGHGGPGRDRVMMFEEIDADGNGEITLEEMTLYRAGRFTGADTDQDGKLSRAELEARAFERMQARVERMLKRHDTDGDGLLSPDELGKPDRQARMFERMDADQSGGISAEEMEQARKHMRGHKHERKARQENKG